MDKVIEQYTKKPVTIEAIRLTDDHVSRTNVYNFINGISEPKEPGEFWPYHDFTRWIDDNFPIKTLEGTMRASYGDYIIKGVKGEFYPCKPDIFEMTYSPATPATSWEEVEKKAREEWMLKHAGEAVVKYDCNFNNYFVEYLSQHWPVSPTPMSETLEKKEVKQNLELDKELTFDELIQHGRDNGANIVNGMPWSWKINGKSITHENDDVYLIETIGGITKRFERNNGQVLIAYSQGLRVFYTYGYRIHAPGGCPL